MFKIEDHVPEYYLKESRDFQLFPRLDDLIFLGQHYNISTINELNNPKKCPNHYLKYLAEKVGFYTDRYIPDKVLINIISTFKTAVKNKGTEKGIMQAVAAILKAENNIEEDPRIVIESGNPLKDEWDQYFITIYTPVKLINEIALKEFLKYIIPSGFNYNIYPYSNGDLNDSIIEINDNSYINYITTNTTNIGIVRKDDDEFSASDSTKLNKLVQDRLIGTADVGIVVNHDDYKKYKENIANGQIPPIITNIE